MKISTVQRLFTISAVDTLKDPAFETEIQRQLNFLPPFSSSPTSHPSIQILYSVEMFHVECYNKCVFFLERTCLKYVHLYIQDRSCFPYVTRFTRVRNKIDPVIRIENTKIQQQKTIPVYFVILPFSFKIPVVSMMMSVCCTATFPLGLAGDQALDKVCTGMRESQRQHSPFKCWLLLTLTIQWFLLWILQCSGEL